MQIKCVVECNVSLWDETILNALHALNGFGNHALNRVKTTKTRKYSSYASIFHHRSKPTSIDSVNKRGLSPVRPEIKASLLTPSSSTGRSAMDL